MCHTKFENWFQNIVFYIQTYFLRGIYIDKGDDPKSLALNSGKIVDFSQTFGTLMSFLLYLMLVLYILD